MNRNLLLLVLCQGLFLTNNVVFIAINGLVGLALAPMPWMSTLAITGYVVGGAISAPMVARLQARYGRKRCFQMGLVVAMGSAAGCALALITRSFPLLVFSTVVAGFYSANAALYRFAGPELVGARHKERAISFVLAGGILGAFIGPALAGYTRDAMREPFLASYLSLIVVAALALCVLRFIDFPPLVARGEAHGRPLREIARQPAFIAAIIAASLGYGTMNLLMAATPIAMQQCQHPFDRAAFVLQAHVLGMFVPSFFTGSLIRRIGSRPVMGMGLLLNLACVAIAMAGIDVLHFTVALLVLGVGWNFLYTAATTLLTTCYTPAEKTTAQGAMDTCVFATMAISSSASGALVTGQGWQWLNLGSLLPLACIGIALGVLAMRRPTTTTA